MYQTNKPFFIYYEQKNKQWVASKTVFDKDWNSVDIEVKAETSFDAVKKLRLEVNLKKLYYGKV